MSDMNASLTGEAPKHYLCQACPPGLQTLFIPDNFATWLGQKDQSLCCCVQDSSSMCILNSHKDFHAIHGHDNSDNVICILFSGESKIVKPLCLTGEKPICSGAKSGCCFESRFGCPSNKDVPWMCAYYGLKCCDCMPFACNPVCCMAIDPLPPAMEVKAMDVTEPTISKDEYMICACGFGMCSMYVPDGVKDAFGSSDNSLCCCVEVNMKKYYLPKDMSAYEMLLCSSGQCKLVEPPILSGGPLCKGVQRNGFLFCKFAVPCDEEVPFAIACPGIKCAEKPPNGPCICFKDERPADPATGFKPLFPTLTKAEDHDVKYGNAIAGGDESKYERDESATEAAMSAGAGGAPPSEAMMR